MLLDASLASSAVVPWSRIWCSSCIASGSINALLSVWLQPAAWDGLGDDPEPSSCENGGIGPSRRKFAFRALAPAAAN